MAKTLLSLPAETILNVLYLLNAFDIVHFSGVSKECYRIVNNFSSVLFRIECCKTFISPAFLEPPVPYEQLLAFLKAREQNWLNLRPSAETVIELPFLKFRTCTNEIFLSAGYIFVRVFKPIVHYLKLPDCSQCLDPQKTNWSRFFLGSDVIHYHLEVEQHDLIVIFTAEEVVDCLSPNGGRDLKVHFKQFSTSEDHPKARWPKFCPNIRLDVANLDVKPAVHIVGNIMVVAYTGDSNELSLLDWQTGYGLKDIVVNDKIYTSFMLISPEILLLPNVQQSTLDIISIPIPNMCSSTSSTLLKKLALPHVKDNAALLTVTFRYSPFRADSHDIVGARNGVKGSDHGLRSLNDHSIVIIDLEFECSGCYEGSDASDESPITCTRHYFSLVTHRSSLRKIAESDIGIINEEYAGIWTDYGSNLAIPWTYWGPPITRWQKEFHAGFLGPGNSCTGHRRIMFPVTTTARDVNSIIIRNYNPYAVKDFIAKMSKDKRGRKRKSRKGKNKVEEKQNGPKVVTTTSILRERGIFFEDIWSSLPYIETEMDGWRYTNVLIDDDRLVAVSSHGKDPGMKILFMSPGDIKFCGCNGDDG